MNVSNHLTTAPMIATIPLDHMNVPVAKAIFWIMWTTLLAMVHKISYALEIKKL